MANNATSEDATFMCILYICLGIISIFCNCLNISIWFSRRNLREKYIYLIALDIGELVNGLSFVLVGTGRGWALIEGYLFSPTSTRNCFFKSYWPHFLILGTALPSFALVLISCERFCAVLIPATYNSIFSGERRAALLATIPLGGLLTVAIGGLSTLGAEGDRIVDTHYCAIISSTALWFSTFHNVVIVLAYSISMVSLSVVWKVTKSFSRVKTANVTRVGVMLLITGSSLILVGIKAFVMICTSWDLYTFSELEVTVTYAMPGLLSIANTVINFVFRRDFRQQFCALMISVKNTSRVQIVTVRSK